MLDSRPICDVCVLKGGEKEVIAFVMGALTVRVGERVMRVGGREARIGDGSVWSIRVRCERISKGVVEENILIGDLGDTRGEKEDVDRYFLLSFFPSFIPYVLFFSFLFKWTSFRIRIFLSSISAISLRNSKHNRPDKKGKGK